MPAAFARLGGFVPATAAIILLGCIAAYSGSLYARLMSVPLPREKAGGNADLLDEIGEEAMGVMVSGMHNWGDDLFVHYACVAFCDCSHQCNRLL